MSITAYPLTWPQGFPRTESRLREKGAFRTSLSGALKNVQGSLNLFARDSKKTLTDIIISSNCALGAQNPDDPGVAVWFIWDGLSVCIAIDRYISVEANLQAIHHIIEARRVELRHGTLALVRASFTGFKALPAPPGEKGWWEVLGVPSDATVQTVKERFRKLASEHHPDRGGDAKRMSQISRAYEEGLKAATTQGRG